MQIVKFNTKNTCVAQYSALQGGGTLTCRRSRRDSMRMPPGRPMVCLKYIFSVSLRPVTDTLSALMITTASRDRQAGRGGDDEVRQGQGGMR